MASIKKFEDLEVWQLAKKLLMKSLKLLKF